MALEESERPSRTERLIEAVFSEGAGIYDEVELAPAIKKLLRAGSRLVHGNREATATPDEDTGAMFLGGIEVLGHLAAGAKERIKKALGQGPREDTPRPWNRGEDC
jgi:hypothetical protein